MGRTSAGILVFFLGSFLAGAQVPTVSGLVVNEQNGTPLAFVNIWITGYPYGTSSNTEGSFEIKIPFSFQDGNHTLSISCIGFHSKKISLSNLYDDPNVVIRLTPSVTKLSDLVIRTQRTRKKNSNKARKLVQRALGQIPKNYPKKPFTLNTFYRHYCSENDSYVRLIEAAMDIHSPKHDFSMKEIPEERLSFRITQLRRSFDFTENAKILHPPISLNYLVSNDLTSFEYHNPLTENLNRYQFSIIDTTTFGEDRVYVVEFSETNREDRPTTLRYRGKLFIHKKTLAFLRAEVTEHKGKRGLTDSVRSQVRRMVTYRAFGHKFFMDRLITDVNVFHATLDSNRAVIDTLRHRAHIELLANNIQPDDPIYFEGKEPRKADLRKIKYDSSFWDHYTVLKETALEARIIEDLSRKVSLQQQFEAFNAIDAGGISIVDSDRFKKLLSTHAGTPLYVVLWSNWGHLNHLDLEPVGYFKRMLKKDRVKLLLVAVENDQEEWINNRKFYGLDQALFQHERLDLGFDTEIARSYLNNVFPYFISVTRQGDIVAQEPPMPNREEVKPFIKSLIKDHWMAGQ